MSEIKKIGIDIQLDEAVAQGVYSNFAIISHSSSEFVLDFAATMPGAGEQVFHSLLSVDSPEQLRLEVASTNERAIRFYEKMGMVKTAELRRWHRVY